VQFSQHLSTTHAGHDKVQQDQVGRLAPGQIERFRAVRGHLRTESPVLEEVPNGLSETRFVVHHEDPR